MRIPKTKIAIISQTLGGGGVERFAGLLSFILNNLGFEVHNIILDEPQDYCYSGALLNLGSLPQHKNTLKRKFHKMMAMKRYLDNCGITAIIDNRTRSPLIREWFTRQVFGSREVYYMIHNYKLDNYLPKNGLLAKWLYKDAEKLICVSKAIEDEVKAKYHFKNTITIYNPINLSPKMVDDIVVFPEKYILYFGRFDEKAKNFSLMLEAFAISEIFKRGYFLLLMGEGADLDFIKSQISQRNLADYVKITPYQKNPFGVVKKSRYTILTSHFEGFPMAITESLAVGTPVIAVDCNSGPREIIVDGQNGLLIENYNATAFARAMNRLIDDEDLYQLCKSNAPKSVAHLSIEAISEKWKEVLLDKNHAI